VRRALVAALDAVAALREAGGREEPRLTAVAVALELAGVDAVRVTVSEALRPVHEHDLHDLRRVARVLELRLAPTPSLLKVALEVRPDRVVLAPEPTRAGFEPQALDGPALRASVPSAVRALREAGLPAWTRIAPDPDAVKAARAAEVNGLELSTAAALELPEEEQGAAFERLADAARLAGRLRLPVRAGGGLDARRLRELVAAAPGLEGVALGRELVARALFVGFAGAVQQLRAELG
jgi:pyridoxine 5-phosphate synthase